MKGMCLSSTGQGVRWHKGPKESDTRSQPAQEQVLFPQAAILVSLIRSFPAASGFTLPHPVPPIPTRVTQSSQVAEELMRK